MYLVVAALSVVVLSSCAGVNTFTAERPKDEAFRTELKRETSTLNIPIETTTENLTRVLNLAIRKELFKGSTATRGVSANVTRNGSIAVSAADNFLYITLPITMKLSYSMFETPAISLKLKFKVKADVTPDWQLHTEIYYLGLSDLVSETVSIGPLFFKPRSIVDGITDPVQKLLSGLLAQKINELFPLKTQVAKVWDMSQKPMLLDKSYSAWLKLTPREIMLYPLYAQNNQIRLSVGISTLAELVVGKEPAASPLRPLPRLKLVNNFDKTFRVALNADLFYKDLLSIASPLLLNKPFNSDGKSIVIKELDLYGNGDKLVVKVQTQGSLDGVFYLTAKPVFNAKNDTFSVDDVDFDMQTQSMLLKSADWLLHGSIRDMIKEKINMDLSKQLEQSRQMVGKALAKVQLMEHVFLKGDVKNLKFSDIIVQKDKISVQVYTEGESVILFQ